jgi:hypothetical protein
MYVLVEGWPFADIDLMSFVAAWCCPTSNELTQQTSPANKRNHTNTQILITLVLSAETRNMRLGPDLASGLQFASVLGDNKLSS